MKTVKRLLIAAGVTFAVLSGLIALDMLLNPPQLDDQGEFAKASIPLSQKEDAAQRQKQVRDHLGIEDPRLILFGDLHVHTTFSMDAFTWSLPLMHGHGTHPPADACDYARFCSRLDFWSTNDHAESLTAYHWNLIRDSIQHCNAISGDPANPDLVSFLGWEWTQMGNTPDTHYGHRVVVLKDDELDKTPPRPVMSGGVATKAMKARGIAKTDEILAPYVTMPFDSENRQQLRNLYYKQDHLRQQDLCDPTVNTRDLPETCMEYAETPADLQRKIREWGFPALVIPHGTTWGYYTPPGVKWDKQLTRENHDPELQRLIEVYSGHGNSEEYRDWRAVAFDENGDAYCPEATDGYQPCCQRAAEIIQSRCEDPASEECSQRMNQARLNYVKAGRGGRLTLPGVEPEDWLNCGQCTDCFMPPFNHRPGNSVQYIMQLSNDQEKDENGKPLRFNFGFIASSDTHLAQPGVGYKEVDRHLTTDTSGAVNDFVRKGFYEVAEPKSDPRFSVEFDLEKSDFNFLQINETERQSAFFVSGGLVAVHSPARDRDSIFESLYRKETYGTSGSRILLWFNLIKPDGSRVPMGSDAELSDNPSFEVHAAGSFEQKPGCPADSVNALGQERLEHMCGGECYNPGDVRIPIQQIEVVRIRPRMNDSEDAGKLIDDPWKVLPCQDSGNGCKATFTDPDFASDGRDTLYYVRALQVPTPVINGNPTRCSKTDDNGRCIQPDYCWGDSRTPIGDDCLDNVSERAWSSPVFVNHRAQ